MATTAPPALPLDPRELAEEETDLDRPAVLLVTTVEIGPNQSAVIEVLEGDEPRDVAHRFCLAHGLPESIVDPLTLHLLDNLESLGPGVPRKLSEVSAGCHNLGR